MPKTTTVHTQFLPSDLKGRSDFPPGYDNPFGHIITPVGTMPSTETPRLLIDITAPEARALSNFIKDHYDPAIHSPTLRHMGGTLYRLAETVSPRVRRPA